MCREIQCLVKSKYWTPQSENLYMYWDLGSRDLFSCSLGDDQLQEVGSVSIGGRLLLTILKGVVGQSNGYLLWVWEVHMYSLKARWDPANLFRFTASWQWDWTSPRKAKESGRPGLGYWPDKWAVAFMYGVSEQKWARTGLGSHNSLHGFLARDYNFFQGKTLHLFLLFLRCVWVCLLLVLRVCVHQKELAKAFFSHFACLTLWPCVLLKPLPHDLLSLLPVWWFLLKDSHGHFYVSSLECFSLSWEKFLWS